MRFSIVFKSLILVFTFLIVENVTAQYNNEWINLDQEYYRIPVAQNGVYKVGYDFLEKQGIPVNDLKLDEIQLWRRGKEQQIKIKSKDNNQFSAGDYFVFYGERANGALDSVMYLQPEYQPHDNYSVFADTSVYFLTWKSGILGKRMPLNSVQNQAVITESVRSALLYDTASYSLGEERVTSVYLSEYDQGEGFMGSVITKGKSQTKTIKVKNYKSSSTTKTILDIVLVGRNNLGHNVSLTIGNTVTQTHQCGEFSKKEVLRESIIVEEGVIENNELKIQMFVNGVGSDADAVSISMFEVKYTSDFDVQSKSVDQFVVDDSQLNNVLLSNASSVNQAFGIGNEGVVEYELTAEGAKKTLSLSGRNENLFLIDSNQFREPDYIRKTEFENDLAESGEYIIFTHEFFKEIAEDYATYRSSPAGGSLKTRIVYIDRVTDQYMFGERSPQGLRNLLAYMIDNSAKPDYLFLLGNGSVMSLNNSGRGYMRFQNFLTLNASGVPKYGNINYVYTYGNPGSDILFSSGLGESTSLEPAVPTGRVSIKTVEQGYNYLNKVKEHESVALLDAWRKNILHLSGGKTSGEANQFLGYMQHFEEQASQPFFGGKTETITKKTTDEVEFFNIAQPLNSGVSLITFMGHSAQNITEIDIGLVSDPNSGYKNKGKYPLLWINGCHAGDSYNNGTRMEDWLYTAADKGALAVMAHSSYGYSSDLYRYTDIFYELNYNDSTWYSKSVAEVQKELVKRYNKIEPESWINHTQSTQMMYYGDPAVGLFTHPQPDYTISENEVNVTASPGEELSALAQSFDLKIAITNYGKVVSDTVGLCIKHIYNNGQTIKEYGPYDVLPVYNKEEIVVTIPAKDASMFGTNQFEITIDCEGVLEELNEENNTYLYEYNLPGNAVLNVLPQNFAIVGESKVDFVYQSLDLLEEREIELELALDRFFADPIYSHTQKGGVIEIMNYQLPNLADTTVYYWRTRFVGEENWGMYSFTYIANKNGWMQSDAQQFAENDLTNLLVDESYESLFFENQSSELLVVSAGKEVEGYADSMNIRVNDQAVVLNGLINRCKSDAVYALAFDHKTGFPYHPETGSFGRVCGIEPRITYTYDGMNKAANRTNLLNYINAIPEGDFLLLSTSGNANMNSLHQDTALVDSIKLFGAQLIDSTKNNLPYVFIGRKGGSAFHEVLGDSANQVLNEEIELILNGFKGVMETPYINVSTSFKALNVVTHYKDGDSVQVSLLTIDSLLNQAKENVFSGDTIIDSLKSLAGKDEVKYLKLNAELNNDLKFEVPAFDYWSISYDPIPELVIKDVFPFKNLYKEGEVVEVMFTIKNVSNVNFDADVPVYLSVYNYLLDSTFVKTVQYSSIDAGESVDIVDSVFTNALIGKNRIEVFVNKYEYVEVNYTNNSFVTTFEVLGDQLNPNLKVLVDDRVLPNKAVVGTEPEIKIFLFDENFNSVISDTANLKLFFTAVERDSLSNKVQKDTLFFTDENLSWATNSDNNSLDVVYSPILKSGFYKLEAIGEDNSGNKINYEVVLEVNESNALVIHSPYPNPFTESLYFEATVFGDVLPTAIQIDLFDVQGKKVVSLNENDFERIAFGEKQIKCEWSSNNALLKSGLYIYRVVYTISGVTHEEKGRVFLMR